MVEPQVLGQTRLTVRDHAQEPLLPRLYAAVAGRRPEVGHKLKQRPVGQQGDYSAPQGLVCLGGGDTHGRMVLIGGKDAARGALVARQPSGPRSSRNGTAATNSRPVSVGARSRRLPGAPGRGAALPCQSSRYPTS